MAREPSPIEGVFPLFNPLLCCASAIVEADYSLRWIAQVGYDEAYSWEQFSLMPLHLGHYSSRNIPTLGLINEVVIRDDGLLRGPLGRPYQQVSYFLLKHFVRRKPYGVADMPCLQVLVNLRLGKSSVCSKQQPHRQLQVALDDGIDELLPAIGAVDVAWSENPPLRNLQTG